MHTQRVVLHHARTIENEVTPVGIIVVQLVNATIAIHLECLGVKGVLVCIGTCLIHGFHILDSSGLLGYCCGNILSGISVEGNLYFTLGTALGGYENNTVRCTRAID